MKYLLDTNACIDCLRRKDQSSVYLEMEKHTIEDILMCSIVFGELLDGAKKSKDFNTGRTLIYDVFGKLSCINFDLICAEYYADIRFVLSQQGKLIGPNDLLIAAIAKANQLTLVTHNTQEFSRVPGLLLADWQTP